MKLKKLLNSLPKRLAAAATIALAVMFPAATMATSAVHIEGALGVANVTAGETTYKASTDATYDQVVKYQVYYHNTELPDSGKIAKNVNVKLTLPTAPGTKQVATAVISADNTNTVTDTATVNLNRSDAYLQFIPGSAVWRHNTGTDAKPVWTEEKISDAVVDTGVTLEDEKPCYNFAATVTVLARVMVPSVKVTKMVRVKGDTSWQTAITAKPGQTVQYLIGYQNTGNVKQTKVVIRDNLPPKMTLVNGTTYLKNTTNPNGVLYNSDNVTGGGIVIGDYAPGSNAYVWFDVKIPSESKLECGETKFRNVGIAKPEGMNEYYNTADVKVTKECEEPKKPVYSCDLLTLTKGDNRTVTAKLDKYTAKDGASLKLVTFDFGDGKTVATDKLTASHTYAADGTYSVSAKLTFDIEGKDSVSGVTSESCVASVTFTTPKTPPETPETPTELPNTGAGDVIGLFGAVTVLSAIGYRLFLGRKVRA